ncbi:MAG: cardiolipin synthase ClsB [Gallionella sp.]
MSSQHRIADHQLTLLQNGTEFFPQLCADIAAAQHAIYFETYRFTDDGIGRRVAESLQQAAVRGVVVRVLLDGFGSSELSPDWLDEWRIAGIEVQWFRREISTFRIRRHRLRRLHRKLVVIDGEVAFIGGINIMDDVPPQADLSVPQLDYAVRVQGAVVDEMQLAMRHLWGVVSWANFRRRGKQLSVNMIENRHYAATPALTFLVRDNVRHRRDIERAYLQAIASAKCEVIIANAYFLPGRVFRRALKQAAQRGVRVVLLLQGKVEYVIQHYATHFLYEKLLAEGVEIYEYQASYLHAKVAVVDGQWATVGSSNIDPFSLLLAREANLTVSDTGFSEALRASLMVAIKNDALRIEKNQLDYLTRFLSRISYGLVRLFVGITGVAKRHGG